MEELVSFFKELNEGFLVPTNLTNEVDSFFFVLKEKKEIFESISSKDIIVGFELPELSFIYKKKDIEVLFLTLIINEEHVYFIPYILNHTPSYESLIRFFGADDFGIWLGDSSSLGLSGPFKKGIIPVREEWDNLKEIEDEEQIELHFILNAMFSSEEIKSIILLQKEQKFNEKINLDKILNN